MMIDLMERKERNRLDHRKVHAGGTLNRNPWKRRRFGARGTPTTIKSIHTTLGSIEYPGKGGGGPLT